MDRDQEYIGVVDKILSIEEAILASKKFTKYHCAPFEDATVMKLFRVNAIITEAVKFLGRK